MCCCLHCYFLFVAGCLLVVVVWLFDIWCLSFHIACWLLCVVLFVVRGCLVIVKVCVCRCVLIVACWLWFVVCGDAFAVVGCCYVACWSLTFVVCCLILCSLLGFWLM